MECLQKAIVQAPPPALRDGGVIACGYDAELDELREFSQKSSGALLAMEARERQSTGLANLKVGYNRVHGYYIELGRAYADKVPPHYVRRQTLKGVERYITPELKTFEEKALSAAERALIREKYLYEALLDWLAKYLLPILSPFLNLMQKHDTVTAQMYIGRVRVFFQTRWFKVMR